MIYVQAQQSGHSRAFGYCGRTPAAGLERKWQEEVLPHYYEPSTRQRTLDLLDPSPSLIESEMELDSPGFTPNALADFEARGFVRRNRWGR